MNILAKIIEENLKKGKTKEDIYSLLLSQKYSIKDIEKGFKKQNLKTHKVVSPLTAEKFYFWILPSFGAVIIGFGVISLVAANWSWMSDGVKMTIVVGFLFLFYILSLLADLKFKILWLGEVFSLIASMIFGANIFLVSQIYNLPIQWQDGFLYWFSGVLFLGLARNSKILYFISFIVLLFSFPVLLQTYFFDWRFSSEFAQGASYIAIILALKFSLIASLKFRHKNIKNLNNL